MGMEEDKEEQEMKEAGLRELKRRRDKGRKDLYGEED